MQKEATGSLEQTLLYALVRLGPDASGLEIARLIEARTGRALSPGALYTALDRLAIKGFVTSTLGDPTPKRGGKRRRLYRITRTGLARLRQLHDALTKMSRGLAPDLRPS